MSRRGAAPVWVERGWRRVYSRRPASRRSVSHSQYGGSTLLRSAADTRHRGGALSWSRLRQTYVLPPPPFSLPTTRVWCQPFTNSFEKYRNKKLLKYFLLKKHTYLYYRPYYVFLIVDYVSLSIKLLKIHRLD